MMPQPSLATQGLSAWLRGPEEPQGLRARSVAADSAAVGGEGWADLQGLAASTEAV